VIRKNMVSTTTPLSKGDPVKQEAQRILAHQELRITVTIQGTGSWGHSFQTDKDGEIMQILQATASDVSDKIRRIPWEKVKG
jgi:hypothetical protein